MTGALSVDHLTVRLGGVEVLHGVSLSVGRGETIAVVGPNGAGKTTLMRTLAGLVRPIAGSIRFEGVDLTGAPTYRIVRAGIGFVPDGGSVFRQLTVVENLLLGSFTFRRDAGSRLDEVFDLFPVLRERARTPAGLLSGGQQRMLSLGRALMAEPSLLLLDEPSLGLSPAVLDDLFGGLVELSKRGASILLVEQAVRRALSISGRGYLMSFGAMLTEAPSARILKDPRLRGVYLGKPAKVLRPE